MKKYIYILSITLFSFTSCDFLDVDESITREDDFMFGYFDEVGKLVTHMYGELPSDWGAVDEAIRATATDNAVHVWDESNVKKFYNGSWSEISTVDAQWEKYYKAIRASNSFLEKFSLDNFDKFQNNEDYDALMEVTTLYPYEVRFLRAFFYFELAKRYGDVPLVTNTCTPDEANKFKKSNFDDVIKFIVDECDSAKMVLPASYVALPEAMTGRATKGACMALKSRALLYAASPLHNPTNDLTKWEAAATAALELINSGTYKLVKGEVFCGNGNNALKSKQLIMESRGGNSNTFEKKNIAMGFEGGNTGTCPSQNLVDDFDMKTGVPFSWDNPAHVANPYYNAAGKPVRDPRLYLAVLNDGAKWQGKTVETFYNGGNAAPLEAATITGYYLRKYLDPNAKLTEGQVTSTPHHYILFRYAEVLLNYAEAMFMWHGPTYKDGTYKLSALDAVNQLRTNATMPKLKKLDLPAIQKERRVELAFEGHRFWDIRRWKIGEVTKNIYGVSIVKDADTDKLSYSKVLVQERQWADKMYLFPIPQTEMFKNPNLTQNLGW